jgi:hypothetical protein
MIRTLARDGSTRLPVEDGPVDVLAPEWQQLRLLDLVDREGLTLLRRLAGAPRCRRLRRDGLDAVVGS